MKELKQLINHLRHWLYPPAGRGVRDLIALFSITQGVLRLIPGALIRPVNTMPSVIFGVLILMVGTVLLLTGKPCRRLSWLGQASAVLASGLWLLLAFEVMGTSWASGINSLIIAGAAANEVRADDC